ncbi:hypothetical protein [Patulibacter sp.]|uniref:hypothetical protein n=1 Tax=Patulibacter sp. TaxID=1912859 RepID=UPI00271FA0DF|nr:hypothetical protein [Patulibacter sp.]MDO9408905.1 hypothetical protein [Patulibacter sp.]
MSDTGPRTPNADRAREEQAAADGRAAGGVRRLTDADAKGRKGRALRRAVGDESELPESRPFVQNLGIVVGAMVGGTVIAELAGAANLGTALSFGQIAFAIALVFVLVKR